MNKVKFKFLLFIVTPYSAEPGVSLSGGAMTNVNWMRVFTISSSILVNGLYLHRASFMLMTTQVHFFNHSPIHTNIYTVHLCAELSLLRMEQRSGAILVSISCSRAPGYEE